MLKINMTVLEDNVTPMKKYLIFMVMFWAVSVSAQITPPPAEPLPKASADTLANFKNPEFPGGHRVFAQQIMKNFRTAIPARQDIRTARVIAVFTVEPDGSMSSFVIESSENELVKDEFLRALKMVTTRWVPAEKDGVKVKVRMRQPLVFVLE